MIAPSSDHYNKVIFSPYVNFLIDFTSAFFRASSSTAQFNLMLYNAYTEAYPIYLDAITEYGKSWKNLSEIDKILRSRFSESFDKKFRQEDFVKALSNAITSNSEFATVSGLGEMYKYFSNKSSVWNNYIIEPIRDTLNRTPSDKICEIDRYSLFHYKSPLPAATAADDEDRSGDKNNTPVLVIYSFINRHYILDLLPNVSIIRSLLNQGCDIFATDWGTPSAYDKNLTIGHFVSKYLDKSIDLIRTITKSEKVSLFGYCWGGDIALMYAATHPEKVKNLITIATPGDFEFDNSLLAVWTRYIEENYLLDAFGNLPGMILNAAFILRNPIEYSHKYFHFFEQPRSLQSVAEFIAIETWLYDSPPIIGEIFREFSEYCYKQNLLIKNKMRINETYNDNNESGTIIDLKNINMPFLNIVAKKDDLVAPSSSKALNHALTESHDKDLIEHNSGHVGLMIGKSAHQEVWPKVGNWLKKHS